jgi:hypothetical protein
LQLCLEADAVMADFFACSDLRLDAVQSGVTLRGRNSRRAVSVLGTTPARQTGAHALFVEVTAGPVADIQAPALRRSNEEEMSQIESLRNLSLRKEDSAALPGESSLDMLRRMAGDRAERKRTDSSGQVVVTPPLSARTTRTSLMSPRGREETLACRGDELLGPVCRMCAAGRSDV